MPDDRTDPTIAIFVYPEVEPIDVGATFGVFSMARRVVPGLGFFLVAEEAGPVVLTNGLTIDAPHGFADCPDHDALMVLGGGGWVEQAQNPAVQTFLARKGDPRLLASVCTGGMILAGAGLLDGRSATTRRLGTEDLTPLERLKRDHPEVDARPAQLIDTGRIVTGGGVTLAIDTALYLLDRFYGGAVREEIARLIEYDRAYAANRAAFEAPA